MNGQATVFSKVLATASLIGMILLPGVATAGARRRAAANLQEIHGVVITASAQWLTVRTSTNDRDVQMTSATLVLIGGRQSSQSMIHLGDKANVLSAAGSRGSVTALAVSIDDSARKEIQGVVHSVSAGSLSITTPTGNVVVTLNDSTVVVIDDHPSAASAITPGGHVEVDALQKTDGTLVALVVQVESNAAEIEGVVTAVSPTSITVRKRDGTVVTVMLTSATVIRHGDQNVAAGNLVVGSRVEIKATTNADHTLTALLIDVQSQDDLHTIRGSVTAIGTGTIKVRTRSGDQVTVSVTADTIIRSGAQLIPLSGIPLGASVEIEARQNADGTLTAVRIQLEDNDALQEIEGTITAIAGSSLTIHTRDGHDVVVLVGAGTRIRRGGSSVPASQLAAGERVSVKAQHNADGSLQAVDINIEEGPDVPEAVNFEGVVTAVSASSITIQPDHGASVSATITADTVVKQHDRQVAVSDIKVGQRVQIKANRKAGGSNVALQIEIKDSSGHD